MQAPPGCAPPPLTWSPLPPGARGRLTRKNRGSEMGVLPVGRLLEINRLPLAPPSARPELSGRSGVLRAPSSSRFCSGGTSPGHGTKGGLLGSSQPPLPHPHAPPPAWHRWTGRGPGTGPAFRSGPCQGDGGNTVFPGARPGGRRPLLLPGYLQLQQPVRPHGPPRHTVPAQAPGLWPASEGSNEDGSRPP